MTARQRGFVLGEKGSGRAEMPRHVQKISRDDKPSRTYLESVDDEEWTLQSSRGFQYGLKHGTKTEIYHLIELIKNRCPVATALSIHGNHALSTAFDVCTVEATTALAMYLQRDEGTLRMLCKDRFGCRPIISMLMHHPARNLGPIRELVIDAFFYLCTNRFGKFVMIAAIEHADDAEFISRFQDKVEMLVFSLVTTCNTDSPRSWDVVAAALTYGQLDWRLAMYYNTLAAEFPRSFMQHVIDRHGSMRWAHRLLTRAAATAA